MNFKNNVKSSFNNVKDNLLEFDIRITALEAQIQQLNMKMEELISLQKMANMAKNEEFKGFKPSKAKIQESSTGNEGVPSTLQQHCNNTATTLQRSFNTKKTIINNLNDVQGLKQELIDKFRALTDAELKVFLTIYNLEEELKGPVNYLDLAQKLGISRASVRGYISDLVEKKIPLIKTKISNRKVNLSIDTAFRNLKLLENLLTLREKEQKYTNNYEDIRKFL